MKAREDVGKKYHSCDNNRKIRRRSTFPDNKDNVEEQENFCTDEQETGNGAKRPTQNANMGHTHSHANVTPKDIFNFHTSKWCGKVCGN